MLVDDVEVSNYLCYYNSSLITRNDFCHTNNVMKEICCLNQHLHDF
jgi:hypothetical protein